jgi:hypothetical protein
MVAERDTMHDQETSEIANAFVDLTEIRALLAGEISTILGQLRLR